MPRSKRRGRPSLLSQLTVADLMNEVERRRKMVGELESQREQLTERLEAIEAELAGLQSLGALNDQAAGNIGRQVKPSSNGRRRPKTPSGGKGRGRRGNEQSLAEVLGSLLKGKTMSVNDMAGAALKTGYKTGSKSFRSVVALTMLKHPKLFKRVSRGQYTAR